jgi:hypothetical protein
MASRRTGAGNYTHPWPTDSGIRVLVGSFRRWWWTRGAHGCSREARRYGWEGLGIGGVRVVEGGESGGEERVLREEGV